MKQFCTLISALLLLCSCNMMNSNDSSSQEENLGLRFTVETEYNSSSIVEVYLEGPDGNMVTGSTVTVRNANNTISLLPFSFDEGCYRGSLPVTALGSYSLTINSTLLDEPLTKTFTHNILQTTPQLEVLQNTDGTSALTGNTLDSSQVIFAGWSEVLGATIYQLQIYKEGILIYTASQSSRVHEIPAGTMGSSGTCSIQVKAQYIEGDPLFTDADYYSYSEASGASSYFDVE